MNREKTMNKQDMYGLQKKCKGNISEAVTPEQETTMSKNKRQPETRETQKTTLNSYKFNIVMDYIIKQCNI